MAHGMSSAFSVATGFAVFTLILLAAVIRIRPAAGAAPQTTVTSGDSVGSAGTGRAGASGTAG
jgi:hypothetical protein